MNYKRDLILKFQILIEILKMTNLNTEFRLIKYVDMAKYWIPNTLKLKKLAMKSLQTLQNTNLI